MFFSALANEIMVRDSIDVERKIYSSTPDQTMLVVQPLTNTFIDDEDLSHYTNYEDDDDADENTIELETISEVKATKKSSKKSQKRSPIVTSTIDFSKQ